MINSKETVKVLFIKCNLFVSIHVYLIVLVYYDEYKITSSKKKVWNSYDHYSKYLKKEYTKLMFRFTYDLGDSVFLEEDKK